ncbi:MAG: ExbD/TolR family protein [Deltaproteobacteria bacterium]|nr:ExbD/TolR family protein [Deltaproteobacteria bacterium]
MNSWRKKGFAAEINVTPFVDVMLVLLIIFMVTAPMLTEGLEVNLPVTKEAQSLPAKAENLVLSIARDGRMFLGQTEVSMQDLDIVLRRGVTAQRKQLFLQADREVPYGLVVEVMGQARAAGIDNVGIVAQRPEEAGK